MIKRKRNLEDIFKSAKIFLKNLNTKKDITRITISQVLSKVITKKNFSNEQYDLCEAETSQKAMKD